MWNEKKYLKARKIDAARLLTNNDLTTLDNTNNNNNKTNPIKIVWQQIQHMQFNYLTNQKSYNYNEPSTKINKDIINEDPANHSGSLTFNLN